MTTHTLALEHYLQFSEKFMLVTMIKLFGILHHCM